MRVFHEKLFPIGLVFFIDVLLTALSFIASYALCSYILPDLNSHTMLLQLPVIVAITSLIFLFIGIYKGYVKYDRLREVYSIFNAICLSNILTIVLVVINGKLVMENDLMIPLSIIIVHSVLSFSALVASRFLYKKINARINSNYKTFSKALLITTELLDDNGVIALRSRADEANKNIFNILHYNQMTDLANINEAYVKQNKISEIIIYDKGTSKSTFFEILEKVVPLSTPISTLQDLKSFQNSEIDYATLFPNQFKIDSFSANLKSQYANKTILVTGAGGRIGGEFVKSIYGLNIKATLVLVDNSESSLNQISAYLNNSPTLEVIPRLVDVKDKKIMERTFETYRPSIIIHAAGNTFLEFLKDDENKVIQQNLTATKLIADLASKFRAEKFVFCSSSRAARPSTTLEVSKRLAEIYLDSLNIPKGKTKFASVRLNKAYDTKNSAVNYIKDQTNLNRPINLRFVYKEDVFTNVLDVIHTLMYVSINTEKHNSGVFSTRLGFKVDANLLIQLVRKIELKGKSGNTEATVENVLLQDDIFKDYETDLFFSSAEEFLLQSKSSVAISNEKIQQKIEHICLNTLFEDNDFSPIFDLINTFGDGKWKKLYENHLNDSANKKIIKLQSN